MSLAAGQLSHTVQLLTPSDTRGDYQDVIRTFVDGPTIRMSLEPLSSREVLRNSEFASDITLRAKCRYREDITAQCRLRHRGHIYEIVGPPINVGQAYDQLELLLREYIEDAGTPD